MWSVLKQYVGGYTIKRIASTGINGNAMESLLSVKRLYDNQA